MLCRRFPSIAASTLLAALLATAHLAAADEIAPQACRVLIPRKGSETPTLCSGTLVAPDLVVTAAHCLPIDPSLIPTPIDVACGLRARNLDGSYAFSDLRLARAARRNSKFVDRARVNRDDFAFLRLDHAIHDIPPLRVPDSFGSALESYTVPNPLVAGDRILDPALECRVAGFSVPEGAKSALYRNSDQSPGRTGLRAYIGDDGLSINNFGSSAESPRRGDAGGPFYCRRPDSSAWMLLAIVTEAADNDLRYSGFTSTVSYRYRELFSDVYAANIPPLPPPRAPASTRLGGR